MDKIRYRAGVKYYTVEDYKVQTSIKPATLISTEYICLTISGVLFINRGYDWDGPSGPTVDTPSFMRGSLVHDALYQLMREGHLDPDTWREEADRELVRLCAEDGMGWLRRQWVYAGVRFGGGPAARGGDSPIIEAP